MGDDDDGWDGGMEAIFRGRVLTTNSKTIKADVNSCNPLRHCCWSCKGHLLWAARGIYTLVIQLMFKKSINADMEQLFIFDFSSISEIRG